MHNTILELQKLGEKHGKLTGSAKNVRDWIADANGRLDQFPEEAGAVKVPPAGGSGSSADRFNRATEAYRKALDAYNGAAAETREAVGFEEFIDGKLQERRRWKSGQTVVVLAVLLGIFGVHNFYLKRIVLGRVQLGLTMVAFLFSKFSFFNKLTLFVLLFALAEAALYHFRIIRTDGRGLPLR